MKFLKTVYISLFLFYSTYSVSQVVSCDEVIIDHLKSSNSAYISTALYSYSSSLSDKAFLTKVSSQGQVLWRVQPPLNGKELWHQKIFEFGNELYIVMVSHPEFGTGKIKVIKINPNNGQTIWTTPLFNGEGYAHPGLIDYGNEIILYHASAFNAVKVVKLNKVNAQLTPLYEQVGGINSTFFNVVLDSKGNIIYTLYSETGTDPLEPYVTTMRKINGTNFNSIIWEKVHPFYYNTHQATLTRLDRLFLDKSDNIYALGDSRNNYFETESMDVFKIDNTTGNTLWKINNIVFEKVLAEHKFSGNSLLLGFKTTNEYYPTSAFEIAKIGLDTGAIEWDVNLLMTPTGTPTTGNGNKHTLNSFDLDCNGDIFATGYYASPLISEGAWGIMKINGQTGAKISDLTITNNTQTLNTLSVGSLAFYFADGPLFVGNLQYSLTESARAYAKVNPDLTSVLNEGYYCFIDSDSDGIADFNEDINGTGFIANDDTDGDGVANYLDNDDDGDGVLTSIEGATSNTDGDAILNYLDNDDDNDSILTITEGGTINTDGDTLANYLDNDDDNDGILTSIEGTTLNSDGDALVNYLDNDDDNDGILTSIEGSTINTDGDTLLNYLDNDDDNDGISTIAEGSTLNSDDDALVNYLDSDDDNDGISTVVEGSTLNSDGDALVNYLDSDDDNDDVPTSIEGSTTNTDGDALANYLDSDDDNDGISTIVEGSALNSDGDALVNYLDSDDDNDGISTIVEGSTLNSDDDALVNYLDSDDDNDGISTVVEGSTLNSDGDALLNYLDKDDDNDGIPTSIEGSTTNTDGDALLDYLDSDDDNDGVLTLNEDTNNDGDPTNDFSDPSNPSLPDYLNPNDVMATIDFNTDSFKIYPNPTTGIINIKAVEGASISSIEVFSITGSKLMTFTNNFNNIDVNKLSSGVYLLRINTGISQFIYNIIKQ